MTNFDDLLTNNPIEGQGAPQLSREDYAAKKKAEREGLFELSDQTAFEVSADGEQFKSFLDLQARLDRYSAVNALLVHAQKPEASRLGGFDYWKQQNCSVMPGQTAIGILEPQAYTKEDGSPGTGYNVKKVFDISQVDTRKLRVPPAPNYTERQILGALISKAPMKIIGVDTLSGDLGAYTEPDTGEIFVRKGMEFSDTFASVAQQLCYAEVEQDGKNTVDPMFTAHCAGYLLCKKYDVDASSYDFRAASEMFHGFEAKDVKQELSVIRDVAENISSRMSRQLEAQQKAAKSQEAR